MNFDDADTPPRGEITRRTQLVEEAHMHAENAKSEATRAEKALSRAEKQVQRLKLFGGVAIVILTTLIGCVWKASKWDSTLARVEDVTTLDHRLTRIEAKVDTLLERVGRDR